MSPERRRFENQRSRSPAQDYGVGTGAHGRAQRMRRAAHSGARPGWGTLPAMFAHPIQNWWWTAHPAAH
ncbi:trp operon leader peptide [Streptomyces olivaceus]|uniref:trp operon leader peptide n=1 Tax=Streptomyces TaxID=1883 RepID=UPI000D146550|nr:trp operon leader peptide [Streptomyces sp. VN1]